MNIDFNDDTEVIIYDLKGSEITKWTSIRWDGTIEGKACLKKGMYLYVLKVNNKIVDSGTITLIREPE